MISQKEKERLLWNLRSLPNELADLIGDFDDETLRWRPIPNKWAVKEILCHLRDLEEVYLARYGLMLSEQNPLLPVVDQDRLVVERDYVNADAESALKAFAASRDEVTRLLDEAGPESWSRTGVHPTAGPLSVDQLVVRQKDHDVRHIIQMKDIIRLKMAW